MKIHEYQGKELLRAEGVPVPQSKVAFTAEEAEAAAAEAEKAREETTSGVTSFSV